MSAAIRRSGRRKNRCSSSSASCRMTQTSASSPIPVTPVYVVAEATTPAKARRRATGALGLYPLIAPTFLLLALFSLVPFVVAIVTSFFDYEVGGELKYVGLSNYVEYFHDYTFLQSFGNMLFLTGFQVIAVMIMPLIVAKLIFSLASQRASYIYRIIFLFPIVVPHVAGYLIW